MTLFQSRPFGWLLSGLTIALIPINLAASATAVGPIAGSDHEVILSNQLVSGVVTRAVDGPEEPVAGATVYVWWIPGMDDAPVGAELAIETVATTRTTADGSYSVDLAPTASMKRAAAKNGGWVNLEVGTATADTGTSARTVTAGISRKIAGDSWDVSASTATSTSTAERSEDGSSGRGNEDPAPEVSGLAPTDLIVSTESPLTAAAPTETGETPEEDAVAVAYCSFIVTDRPQRATSVVEFHNASNSNATWTYGQSADSDIEQGIDYSGNGGWTVGVTRHIANSTSATVGRTYTDRVNNYGRTDFEFVDGYYKATLGSGPGNCQGTSIPVGTKVKNPIEWVGGVSSSTAAGSEFIGCSSSPQSDHRTGYPKGAFFTRDDNSAAKIGAALTIGPLSLGATSGYSKRMDMRWEVKRGTGIWLCGTNYGVMKAGVIHAQNRD